MTQRGIPGLIAYPLSREFARGGSRVRLDPQEFLIAIVVFAGTPAVISNNELFEWLYGDDPNGGPLQVDNCIKVRVCNIRRKMAPLGVTLWGSVDGHKRGMRYGGFRGFDLWTGANPSAVSTLQKPQHHGAANASDAPQALCFPVVPVISGFVHASNFLHGATQCLGLRERESFAENKGNHFP